MTQLTDKELLMLKQQVDKAKTKVSELKGKEEYLMTELNKKWHCSSIKQAEKLLEQKMEESNALRKKINFAISELSETYKDVINQ